MDSTLVFRSRDRVGLYGKLTRCATSDKRSAPEVNEARGEGQQEDRRERACLHNVQHVQHRVGYILHHGMLSEEAAGCSWELRAAVNLTTSSYEVKQRRGHVLPVDVEPLLDILDGGRHAHDGR